MKMNLRIPSRFAGKNSNVNPIYKAMIENVATRADLTDAERSGFVKVLGSIWEELNEAKIEEDLACANAVFDALTALEDKRDAEKQNSSWMRTADRMQAKPSNPLTSEELQAAVNEVRQFIG